MTEKRMALSDVKNGLSKVIEEIQKEGSVVIVTVHGHDAARISPLKRNSRKTHHSGTNRSATKVWNELDEVAERIRAQWPSGISAQDALDDVRS